MTNPTDFMVMLITNPEQAIATVKDLIAPVVELLNDRIPEINGRRFHLVTVIGEDFLGHDIVNVTVGHYNASELRAAEFYRTPLGSNFGFFADGNEAERVDPSLRFGPINARSYDFAIEAGPSGPVFTGYLQTLGAASHVEDNVQDIGVIAAGIHNHFLRGEVPNAPSVEELAARMVQPDTAGSFGKLRTFRTGLAAS